MRRAVANDVVLAAAPFVSEYFTITPAGVRTVYMDAWRSEALTRELIGSESTRLFDFRRFDRAQFEALHAVLEDDLLDSQFISSQQRLLIFPHYVATGCHYRSLRETFNHALGSIHTVFHQALRALLPIHPLVVRQAIAEDAYMLEKCASGKYFPWFEDCGGALDGSHVYYFVRGEQAPYLNRKGFLSQNVLGMVDHEMRFMYLLAG
jgi:hypothetical protein